MLENIGVMVNDFALAEEVTFKGGYERRPDIVLYINGIAIAVIELKRSSVDVADGIRQLITNQEAVCECRSSADFHVFAARNDLEKTRRVAARMA
ncbi:type I restriction endonuclease [Methylomonas sp. DH-1]|uniref:type I restriction endonuclease n=1 Tax=Methylomonas sp. (strain DH-1) TaxID=1727196 RepID=UPI001E383430|nr:type I restriction endonuclease [Methylomonas sp. DH-1]